MAETRTVICHHCGKSFECKAKIIVCKGERKDVTQLKRRICPDCLDGREKQWESKRAQRLKLRPGETRSYYIQHRKLEDVAKSLGITIANAAVIERKALAKIREHPELSKLFRQWMEEGGRSPADFEEMPREDIGNSLVEYTLELSNWYEIYDQLLGNGKTEEALECQREIENFYKAFKKQLAKLSLLNE